MRTQLQLFLLTLAAFVAGASSAPAGNVFAGRTYARQACAECHSVEPTKQVEPLLDVPSFYVIAQMPGMSELAISVWLRTPHDKMPDFAIGRDDRENLAAYIMSLRGREAR